MLTAAPLATAPRKKQQRRNGPCNDCSNLRVNQATVGVDKQKKQSILPSEINSILDQKKSAKIKQSGKADKILSRPNIFLDDLKKCDSISSFIDSNNLPKEVQDQAEIQIKYSGYIEKEKANADKLNRLESVKIPKDFDYKKLKSISAEALEKLRKIKPETISQASRISGVSPNDISVLLVYMGR